MRWDCLPKQPSTRIRALAIRSLSLVRLGVVVTLSAAPALSQTASGQSDRPLTIDDVFALRTLAAVSPSPVNDWLAVVVRRSWTETPAFRPYNMIGNDQADVWLISKQGGTPRNLTRGAEQRLGYWNPVWSPDGRHLAVLTTACSASVGLALVNARSGVRRCLTDRAVNTRSSLGSGLEDPNPLLWIDDARVLVSLLPPGVQVSEFAIRRYTPTIARTGWHQAQDGRVPSVSVLSTLTDTIAAVPQPRLVMIDIRSGQSTTLFEDAVADVALAPSRTELAVAVGTRSGPRAVVRIDVRSGRRQTRSIASNADAVSWTTAGRLLARMQRPGAERWDWYRLGDAEAGDRNLTSALADSPDANVCALGDSAIVVAAAGKLWRLALDGGAPVAVPLGNDAVVTRIIAPMRHEARATSPSRIAVMMRQGTSRLIYDLDLQTGATAPMAPPTRRAGLAALDLAARRAYFTADEADGTFLWTVTAGSGTPKRVLTLNEHLARSLTSRRMMLRYRSVAGDSLSAVVLLPPQYVPNQRYPMVTWVYPGVIVSDSASATVDFWLAKNHAHPDNLHLLAAQGYAVLIPSMPLGPIPRDPYAELPNGVLPAVSAAVATGIADSARVAVMGQSFGGYATFGLITQTDRFAAAIAISGFADLFSNYGTFDGERRYRDDAHLARVQARFSEGDVIGLARPPWADPDRYVRNSPLFHVSRARTPILIIHGDIDYVPIQQSEEFFTALQRLGRPAEFARYWGESHGATDSSANARDRWERVLAWLARWL